MIAKCKKQIGKKASQTATTVAFMFSSCSRIGDVQKTLSSDVFLSDPTTFRVGMLGGKGDQKGEGRDVYVKQDDTEWCAFPWIAGLKKALPDPDAKFFASRAPVCEMIKRWSVAAGKDPSEYSAHSLRHGGAHHLALRGVQTSAIKARGGWKSDAVERYIDLDDEEVGNLVAGL